jgi:FtsH-binding integral membrane protein
VFAVATGLFATMGLYGYSTKKDLTSLGSFMMMGLFGLIITMIINMFMKSSTLSYVLSAVGVLIFTGITAYDVQHARLSYSMSDDNETAAKKVIWGAFMLYLDFINLFLHMLRLFGNKK